MSTAPYNQNAYGLSQALINVFPAPIVSHRAPLSTDKEQIGSLWVQPSANSAWVITSIINNSANWENISGGSGSFTNLTVSGTSTFNGAATFNSTSTFNGNVAINGSHTLTMGSGLLNAGSGGVTTSGNLVTTGSGSIQSASTVTAVSGMTVTTGGLTTGTISGGTITAHTGNIIAEAGNVYAGATAISGMAGTVSMTASNQLAAGTGTLSFITVSGSTNYTNAGFIKFFNGTATAWVPYFTTVT